MSIVEKKEHERMKSALEYIAEHDCSYGDGCVEFSEGMKRHYSRCIPCIARLGLGK